MRDPNDITDEPRKWFRVTEEWLDARLTLTSVASEAAAYDAVSRDLSARAGVAFANGKDLDAELLRAQAKRLAGTAAELHRTREKRLKELDLIDPGYGPQDHETTP